jgi:hypothetical protein
MKHKSLSKSNVSSLKLTELLRRRRTTLRQYILEFGITTYETLCERCTRIGVLPPSQEEFLEASPPVVNSPAEGVVVLEAPPVIKETSGRPIDPETNEELPLPPAVSVVVLTEDDELHNHLLDGEGEHVLFQKPSKKKKKKSEIFELPPE